MALASLVMAAAVEQSYDDFGIIWPAGIAPAHVCVIPLSPKPDEVTEAAEELAKKLSAAGYEKRRWTIATSAPASSSPTTIYRWPAAGHRG